MTDGGIGQIPPACVVLVRQGNIARDDRRWAEAVDAYRKALSLDPSMRHIWVRYGQALKEGGDLINAEDAYRTALALGENIAHTHLQLGRILKLRQRWEEARAANARAVELDPTLTRARRELNQLNGRLAVAVKGSEDDVESALRQASLQDAAGELEAAAGTLGRALQTGTDHEGARAQLQRLRRRLNEKKRRELAEMFKIHPDRFPVDLTFVAIGTTGLCNASCIHCPTGKMETAHVPRNPMPMPLFEKLIREMADLHLVVNTRISFGLFGDGLVDPFVVERARLVRTLLPEVRLGINTNGAAYNHAKHQSLSSLISVLALHVESLVPETYATLMRPLRAERVFPKFLQLLKDFGNKVVIGVPVSKLNLNELAAIRSYFLKLGAGDVHFGPLMNRCAENSEPFGSLALDPYPNKCGPKKGKTLIVDCDGQVLICCQDFRREEPIGNLNQESLLDVLLNAERKKMIEQFSTGRHAERKTCSRCHRDFPRKGKWRRIVNEALAVPVV